MRFYITIRQHRDTLTYWVENITAPAGMERFRITRDGIYFDLQSNRPMLRARGLKHKRPQWTLLTGNLQYANYQEAIIEQIMNKLEPGENSPSKREKSP